MVLPALVVIALLAVAYLLLFPSKGARETADTRTTGTAGAQPEAAAPGADAGAGGGVAEPPRDNAAPPAGLYTSAAVMDSAFASNPSAASVRYAGPVRVSGVIATVVQPGPTPSLSLEGRTRFNFVIVNFPEGYTDRLAPLSKGRSVTVSCVGARSLAGSTILSGCLLV